MARRLVVLALWLAVAFADDGEDARAAAAADHLRASELKELLTKAGVEFGCVHRHELTQHSRVPCVVPLTLMDAVRVQGL